MKFVTFDQTECGNTNTAGTGAQNPVATGILAPRGTKREFVDEPTTNVSAAANNAS